MFAQIREGIREDIKKETEELKEKMKEGRKEIRRQLEEIREKWEEKRREMKTKIEELGERVRGIEVKGEEGRKGSEKKGKSFQTIKEVELRIDRKEREDRRKM